MLKPIQLLPADRTQGNSFQSKVTCAPACTSPAARRVQSLCQPCCAHHTPRSPCSFPGEIQNPLIPQGIMSLLHPLTWSPTSSLCLSAAFPVTQDLSLKKSQWNSPWVRSSLVRPGNPSPRKHFNFSPVTHHGQVVTGLSLLQENPWFYFSCLSKL